MGNDKKIWSMVEIEPLLIEQLKISKWWPKDFQVMIEFFPQSTIENFQSPNLVTKNFQARTENFQSANFLLPKLLIEKLDDQNFAIVIINLTKKKLSPKKFQYPTWWTKLTCPNKHQHDTNAKWACHVTFDNLVLIKLLQYKRLCECIHTIVSNFLQKYTRTHSLSLCKHD